MDDPKGSFYKLNPALSQSAASQAKPTGGVREEGCILGLDIVYACPIDGR